ncbi:hypothetical protein BU24DRAFT_467726 [Aaosphaeria arxii CBS 175.79]|uniref:Uncharacterized protein n=1 Tax=Aaosphaeria arxii CBS 175.79 TaxID=1450172 RepID=A0A6A5XBF0_9PLEO|nr:uncharacterized protein BU24DRAFT_467726 [Aaosphaeria arxii CBS 175.79]KAF2010261.1 hypothetical protein BU24DRAFT_467726 [Aaosphaeria arxii CBS 175.79]
MPPSSQAPSARWDEPYEYLLLIVAVLHLVGFVLWEKYAAKDPILPFDIWEAPSFPALILVSLMAFMSFGVLSWYITLWLLTIRDWSLLLASAAIVPQFSGRWLRSWLHGSSRAWQPNTHWQLGRFASSRRLSW